MNNDKTSPREGGAPGPHRLLLRGAATMFILLGAMWLLMLVLIPFVAPHVRVAPVDLLEQGIFGLVPLGVGALLYAVAPRLME